MITRLLGAFTLTVAFMVVGFQADAATWEPEQYQVPSPSPNATLGISPRPAVSDPEGNVHLVFQNTVDTIRHQIVYIVRSNQGDWGAPLALSSPEYSSRNASLSLDGFGGLHVVWEADLGDGDIQYRYRSPEGVWGDVIPLSPATGNSSRPQVGVDAFNRVHVVWNDARGGYPQILYCTAALGEAFSDPRVISLGRSLPDDVTMAADGLGAMHFAWTDRVGNPRDGLHFDIFYMHVPPGQEATAQAHDLISGQFNSSDPYLAASQDGSVHLVWLDTRPPEARGMAEIFYQRFLSGIGWGKAKRFTYDLVPHASPVIVETEEGSLNVVWEDYRTGNPDVYFRQITDATGWDPRSTRLTADPSSSQTPFLVPLPAGKLLMLWTDALGTGDFRVYTKTGTVASN